MVSDRWDVLIVGMCGEMVSDRWKVFIVGRCSEGTDFGRFSDLERELRSSILGTSQITRAS